MDKNQYEELLAFLKKAYIKYQDQNFIELDRGKITKINHQLLGGTIHWIFTEPKNVDIELNIMLLLNCTKTVGIALNLEFVLYALRRGRLPKYINFYADCKWKYDGAISFGLPEKNVYMIDDKKIPKTDYFITNIPFDKYVDFVELIKPLYQERALIISSVADYKKSDSFRGVEYYRYLGTCFNGVRTCAASAIFNHQNTFSTTILDKNGKKIELTGLPLIAPGDDMDEWIWAVEQLEKIKKKKRKSMVDVVRRAKLDRKNVIFQSEQSGGIPLVFGAGKAGLDALDKTEFTKDPIELSTKSSKYSWTTVAPHQIISDHGVGFDKICLSRIASTNGIGEPTLVKAGSGCSGDGLLIFKVYDNGTRAMKYLKHPTVKRLFAVLNSNTPTISRTKLSLLPHWNYAKDWIDDYD